MLSFLMICEELYAILGTAVVIIIKYLVAPRQYLTLRISFNVNDTIVALENITSGIGNVTCGPKAKFKH